MVKKEPKKEHDRAFKELGARYRQLRYKKGMVQEDVAEYGFSVRHYQQLEGGRAHTIRTLFEIAEMYGVEPKDLLKDLPKKK